MTTVYEPQLQPVEIADLRPTQITVGLLEVADKRQEWRRNAKKHGPEYLGRHMVPVVLARRSGPIWSTTTSCVPFTRRASPMC